MSTPPQPKPSPSTTTGKGHVFVVPHVVERPLVGKMSLRERVALSLLLSTRGDENQPGS
jgi:hypothetical protein